ncbi:MAG: hypothetical protein ACYTXY_50475, partial [Nostoc sp.]
YKTTHLRSYWLRISSIGDCKKHLKLFFTNVVNVNTYKMKVTTKTKPQENSLTRRTRKVSNLEKIDILMF